MCVCVFVHSSGRFSESLMEMMKKFAKDVYSVSTQKLMYNCCFFVHIVWYNFIAHSENYVSVALG